MLIRRATESDAADLLAIDDATHSIRTSPAPKAEETSWVGARLNDLLVAEVDHSVVGYVLVGHPTPLPSNAHVMQIQGFAVSPAHQRMGIGRALLDETIALAVANGARKVTLRVLASNEGALHLYRSAGFTVEGVLQSEFLLENEYVDDVWMAIYP